ncbi:MAG: phospho-N-acetylmuramoyl-pentapeptide-transferase [bacterium]|nr:phospho-N-acetylmuramoyl-pentapeptide-transferase [bacterium]
MINTRSILILCLSLIFSIAGFKLYLRYFKSLLPKHVRDYGPKSHLAKEGTPTMGGLVIFLSALLTLLVLYPTREVIALLSLITGYAVIGGIDDYAGIKKRSSQPLKGRYKFIAECLITLFWLWMVRNYNIFSIKADFLIFRPDNTFWQYLLETVFIVGVANGVNFTDGVDGLAGTIITIVLSFTVLIFRDFNVISFSLALIGGLLVFLFYNAYPAKLIMGDIGSLSLGASVAGIGIAIGREWFIIILGIIFILENLSVILQVSYFKLTGKRIFKMSPLHHHFELSGWSEPQVVTRFSLLTLLAGIMGVFINGLKG